VPLFWQEEAIVGKPETKITTAIRDELRQHQIFCFKIWQGPFSRPGIPDIVGLTQDGRFVGVEVKTENGRLSPVQGAFLRRIRESSGIAFCARSRDDVRRNLAEAGILRVQSLMF
jgi:hypothetical protein